VRPLLAALLVALAAGSVRADVACPPILSSGMVLQADAPVPVWGTAAPGEAVAVEFAGQSVATVAGADGRWRVALAPLRASAEPRALVVRGTNTLRFDDVLVGEVWFASGQSNMEKPLGLRRGQEPTDDAAAEIAAARHPQIRLFQVPRNGRPEPDDLTLAWHACAPETIDRLGFSAAAYFFGREIHRRQGVPVGLVVASVGGTRLEQWMPPDALAAPPEPAAGPERRIDGAQTGGLHRSMVAPLLPFAVRGFLWYQGESNLIWGETAAYAAKQRALIAAWRRAWERPEAPFYFVQLAPYLYSSRPQPRPLSSVALPLFWEAQAATLDVPGTGMAVITDTVAKLSDIHPTNKRDVGLRLAALALRRTYGRDDAVDSGPVYAGHIEDGDRLVVRFGQAVGLRSRDGQALRGFEVAGADRRFHPATATIYRDSVALASPAVTRPVAARYAWTERGGGDLVNGAGLPARPFRTDGWPAERFRPATAADAPALRLPAVPRPEFPATVVSLAEHGGRGDGTTDNAAAFARAVYALVARGGGRLLVPAGLWLSGPIVLRSGVELHLAPDAVLRRGTASPDEALLTGDGLERLAVSGAGTVEGGAAPDAPLLSLRASRSVLVEGVTWRPAAGPAIRLEACSAVTVRSGQVRGSRQRGPEAALELDSCREVLVEDMAFDLGGDAIRLAASQRGRPAENITIRRTTIERAAAGIVLGERLAAGIRQVLVTDVVVREAGTGVRFAGRREGGGVDGITVQRLRLGHLAGEAVLFDPDVAETPASVRATPPSFRNLVLRDFTVARVSRPSLLRGLPGMPLETVRVEGWNVSAGPGLVLRDADGVTVEAVRVPSTAEPALALHGVRGAVVRELRGEGTAPDVAVAGTRTDDVALFGGPGPEPRVRIAPDVPPGAVVPAPRPPEAPR
jgi:sialate O-acetylesterase